MLFLITLFFALVVSAIFAEIVFNKRFRVSWISFTFFFSSLFAFVSMLFFIVELLILKSGTELYLDIRKSAGGAFVMFIFNSLVFLLSMSYEKFVMKRCFRRPPSE